MFSKKNRILKLPKVYYDAIKIGNPIFPVLFEFENGLRLVINDFLKECYGDDWWETSLKYKKKDIYDYVEDQKVKKNKMPWIGDSSRTTLIPLHSVTLGHLEEIVTKYQSDCIPELFPSIAFFNGHMEIIKRVRNLFGHMYPCITKDDILYTKNEITTLCKQIKYRLEKET